MVCPIQVLAHWISSNHIFFPFLSFLFCFLFHDFNGVVVLPSKGPVLPLSLTALLVENMFLGKVSLAPEGCLPRYISTIWYCGTFYFSLFVSDDLIDRVLLYVFCGPLRRRFRFLLGIPNVRIVIPHCGSSSAVTYGYWTHLEHQNSVWHSILIDYGGIFLSFHEYVRTRFASHELVVCRYHDGFCVFIRKRSQWRLVQENVVSYSKCRLPFDRSSIVLLVKMKQSLF